MDPRNGVQTRPGGRGRPRILEMHGVLCEELTGKTTWHFDVYRLTRPSGRVQLQNGWSPERVRAKNAQLQSGAAAGHLDERCSASHTLIAAIDPFSSMEGRKACRGLIRTAVPPSLSIKSTLWSPARRYRYCTLVAPSPADETTRRPWGLERRLRTAQYYQHS